MLTVYHLEQIIWYIIKSINSTDNWQIDKFFRKTILNSHTKHKSMIRKNLSYIDTLPNFDSSCRKTNYKHHLTMTVRLISDGVNKNVNLT